MLSGLQWHRRGATQPEPAAVAPLGALGLGLEGAASFEGQTIFLGALGSGTAQCIKRQWCCHTRVLSRPALPAPVGTQWHRWSGALANSCLGKSKIRDSCSPWRTASRPRHSVGSVLWAAPRRAGLAPQWPRVNSMLCDLQRATSLSSPLNGHTSAPRTGSLWEVGQHGHWPEEGTAQG